MPTDIIVNDVLVRFANVNGTGSASANTLFAKSIFRMGIPVSPKNIFPSNIQGLPTWYEVRVNEKGYLGRREGIEVMVAVNPQSFAEDVASVKPGGYFIYDNSKWLEERFIRPDLHYIGIPMIEMCNAKFSDARVRQLLKNVIYVGALTALLNIEIDVVKQLITEQFKGKEKLVQSNFEALEMGINYIKEHYELPIKYRVERRNLVGDAIMIDGNTACGLGALWAGATVAAWYPITPSTSLVNAFEEYAQQLRKDPETGKNNFAVVQAEDELAAIGMVIGATWNGARAFTATSGPGVSLMNEFLGLAYFAEIPAVLIDVQRGGPSTGMPTRTQQSDLMLAFYASHGDTKHPLLLPADPHECFELTAQAFDLSERLQTPIMVMTDLDLGMNDHMSKPFRWDPNRKFDRGKVLSKEDLDRLEKWGRYLDVDGDGLCYRTLPGTHPTKGAYFARGTSRDEFARYSESEFAYKLNMDRLLVKWETIKKVMPKPHFYQNENQSQYGVIFFGTTTSAAEEVLDRAKQDGLYLDAMRLKAAPFDIEVKKFIDDHETVFVIEQNRDAQMRSILINELEISPEKLVRILHYDGMPITADNIEKVIKTHLTTILV